MNCDEAFDALTDPSGLYARELEQHLVGCPRCRDLREVLDPALSLLCGEQPEEQNPMQASHSPFLSAESIRLAESTAAQLKSRGDCDSGERLVVPAGSQGMVWLRRRRSRRAIGVALRSAALVLLGGIAVYFVGTRDHDSLPQQTPGVLPAVVPDQACTRNNYPAVRKGTYDAERVVLSCVVCHSRKRESHHGNLDRGALLWPASQRKLRLALLLCDVSCERFLRDASNRQTV